MKTFSALLLVLTFNVAAASAALLPSLPQPPARGSLEDKSDFDQILFEQSIRSAADCARAVSEAGAGFAELFGPPYGPLTSQEVSVLSADMERLGVEADLTIEAEKDIFRRPRPYLEDSRVQPCVHKESSFAYPSGHATLAELLAQALIRVFPERDPGVFRLRARQIGDDRVLGGVHHPTDIAAGQTLGQALFTQWITDPSFNDRLQRLSQQVHAGPGH